MVSTTLNRSALDAQLIEDFLRLLISNGHLRFEFTITIPALPPPELSIELSGPDVPLLIDRNGELLHAIEHIAAKILRLEPEEHDRISIDAGRFKADRDQELRRSAVAAVAKVRATAQPFAFPPMTSRERRLLHLALKSSGLPTASSGEGPRRFVVLYPEGQEPAPPPAAPPAHERAHAIRNNFRRR
jgi:spoIIIJ-associated protein